jgi:hypothetical protein
MVDSVDGFDYLLCRRVKDDDLICIIECCVEARAAAIR